LVVFQVNSIQVRSRRFTWQKGIFPIWGKLFENDSGNYFDKFLMAREVGSWSRDQNRQTSRKLKSL